MTRLRLLTLRLLAASLAWVGVASHAGVLPEDRADALYHVYQGDGITVQGPALLVRKKFGESVGVNLTYDHDSVTGASIDSRTSGASSLKEKRNQWSLGSSYLRGKTTYNVNFMNSKETDYKSDNLSFAISEDMFGDLTTVTLGFTRGWDEVSKNEQTTITPMGTVQRRSYRLGLSQILTRKLIATVNFESGALEGYLQNPYRSVRYGSATSTDILNENEKYPTTRTSNALGLEGRYYLPWRAAVGLGYRYYKDSWSVIGHTGELSYLHPATSNLTLEGSVRYYTQTRAAFYADLFPFSNAQNFLARDKILSSFDDVAVRIGASYRFVSSGKHVGTLSLYGERVQYNYKDFRDATDKSLSPVNQPLFSFGATVFMLQYSHRYFWWSE